MRVVVAGAKGLLGAAIVREFSPHHEVRALDRAALDVTDAGAVAALVDAVRPDLVINCAAYNHVDRAQDEPGAALEVNAFAVQSMARAAAGAGCTLVHYGSDFVFDGETERPYTEQDAPSPQGTYAASKLLGEWFALEYSRAYVLRVESLFGPPPSEGTRRGSLASILDGLRRGVEVRVFVDRTVSPSYTTDVAAATRQIVSGGAPPGLYHCVNSGSASWAEIAAEAARLLGVPARLEPITLQTAALTAPRPRFCALSNAKLAGAGIRMPTWQDALGRYLEQLPRSTSP